MTQEDVIALCERASRDGHLRARLRTAESPVAVTEVAAAFGFRLSPPAGSDDLSDIELDGIAPTMSDRTCFGTTDCCQTKRTCFGTTACC